MKGKRGKVAHGKNNFHQCTLVLILIHKDSTFTTNMCQTTCCDIVIYLTILRNPLNLIHRGMLPMLELMSWKPKEWKSNASFRRMKKEKQTLRKVKILEYIVEEWEIKKSILKKLLLRQDQLKTKLSLIQMKIINNFSASK